MSLTSHELDLAAMTTEQTMEHERLAALKRQVADAQESHAKHVSEVNAQPDAQEKKIQANADARATTDCVAL